MSSDPHILLIDDHAMFRTGLAMVLHAAWPEAGIHEVAFLEEAMDLSAERMDVVLLDIHLVGLSGLACITPLKRRWPGVKVVALSADTDAGTAREALTRGAQAFVAKTRSAPHIVEVVRAALAGELDTTLLSVEEPARPLTPRQVEVVALMHQGLANKQIAQFLGLSENTVRRHVQDILALLGVGSRTEAVFVARQRGLVY